MSDHAPIAGSRNGLGNHSGPGIEWVAGDEDYPFPSRAGETAVEYFARWLKEAPYASIERQGARYLHETDVTNVLNHITADVALLRARLDEFGDRVLTAADYKATIRGIDEAMTRLAEARAALKHDGGEQDSSTPQL